MFLSFKQLFADRTLNKQMLRRGVLWTLVVAIILGLGSYFANREKREIALARARDSFQKDVTTRLWVTQRGGVYVPLDEKTQANPYLKDLPNREITTTTGKVYTLVNPAYMTRMLHELGKMEYGLQGHGGAITVESRVDEGSVFRLYFPVAIEGMANQSEPTI